MKHTYKIFLVVFVASLFTGCNLDINTDPNRVTETTVTGALIFPAAAHEVGQRTATGNMGFLNKWLGYWASSGTFAIDFTETTYSITPTFADNFWINHYNVLFDLEQARSKALAAGDTLTAGASIILASKLWQELVDVYGKIPYTQALQYAKYPQPTYDDGQVVYNDLQVKLDLAISYMGKVGLTTFKTVDIVNKGNKAKWIKFANTMKLRLLMHQSEIGGFDPTAEITKIRNSGGILLAGETVSVNPGYTLATNKQSPYYNNYGLTVNLSEASPSTRANNYFVTLMNNNGDLRLSQLFLKSGANVIGNVYGLAAGNPLVSSGVGAGLANNAAQDQWIFTAFESLFLKAEAIERGWYVDADTDPAVAYAAAVTESFVWLGVPSAAATAAAYLTGHPYSAVLGNSGSILFQKYLALAGTDPIEAWSDLRRISFSIIPATSGAYQFYSVNPSALGNGQIPIRLLYAQSEYTTNGKNVPAQATGDQFTSPIFWDVTPY
jgi:hypothetical protein